MITRDPYGVKGAAGAGQDTEPAAPVSARDTPEMVARCLNCRLPAGKCRGTCEGPEAGMRGPGRPVKVSLDELARLSLEGVSDGELRRRFGLFKKGLENRKARCRALGLLPPVKKSAGRGST